MQTLNGQEYQLATTGFTVQGKGLMEDLDTVTKVSLKRRAVKKPVYNSQGQIIGFTIDKYEIEATIGMKLSEWFLVCDTVRQANPGKGLGQCQFDFSISFGQSVSAMRTVTLLGCMFNEDPRDLDENQEAGVVEIPLFVMRCAEKDADGNDIADFVEYDE